MNWLDVFVGGGVFAQRGAASSDGWHFVGKMLKTELGSLLLLHTCSVVNRTRGGKSAVSAVYLAVVIGCSSILKNRAASIYHDSVPLKKVSGLFLM